jgi:hypothetical protein
MDGFATEVIPGNPDVFKKTFGPIGRSEFLNDDRSPVTPDRDFSAGEFEFLRETNGQ